MSAQPFAEPKAAQANPPRKVVKEDFLPIYRSLEGEVCRRALILDTRILQPGLSSRVKESLGLLLLDWDKSLIAKRNSGNAKPFRKPSRTDGDLSDIGQMSINESEI